MSIPPSKKKKIHNWTQPELYPPSRYTFPYKQPSCSTHWCTHIQTHSQTQTRAYVCVCIIKQHIFIKDWTTRTYVYFYLILSNFPIKFIIYILNFCPHSGCRKILIDNASMLHLVNKNKTSRFRSPIYSEYRKNVWKYLYHHCFKIPKC